MQTTGAPQRLEDKAQAWFAENAPTDWEAQVASMDDAAYRAFQTSWLRTLSSRGYAAPGVARRWGGGGYSVRDQATIYRTWARSGAPPVDLFEVSLNHVPSTFLVAGTVAQQEQYIRPALNGVVWCQGFSEPGAGSDLTALTTRAVRDGEGWRVTGQKTWSSHAALASHCLLLARTDPDSTHRRGITYFVMDMDQPGIDVRPIRQNHGPNEFCELFLDSVWIPDTNRIGPEGDGWRVAQATLAAERGPIALPIIERIGVGLADLVRRHTTGHEATLGHVEGQLAALVARHLAVRSMAYDLVDLVEQGRDTAGASSVLKVAYSELLQEVADMASLLEGDTSLLDTGSAQFLGYVSQRWFTDWLGSWATTIAGGANEIQRDLIGERLLGLPRDPARHRS